METRNPIKKAFIVALLFVIPAVFPIEQAMADHDHRDSINYSLRAKDDGNEETGLAAAWLFAVANFSIALSLLIKASKNVLPFSEEFKEQLIRFNRFQKRYLMKLHYWLNPIALAVASSHWTLSRCYSSELPEWGLILLLVLVGLGFVMKFKLAPKTMRRTLYRLHTNPIPIGALVCILLIGHSIVD